jgi:hypothetical protein
MEIRIDETAVAYFVPDPDFGGGLPSVDAPCSMCGAPLGLPYMWIVFDGDCEDFFVHEHCVTLLKARQKQQHENDYLNN